MPSGRLSCGLDPKEIVGGYEEDDENDDDEDDDEEDEEEAEGEEEEEGLVTQGAGRERVGEATAVAVYAMSSGVRACQKSAKRHQAVCVRVCACVPVAGKCRA